MLNIINNPDQTRKWISPDKTEPGKIYMDTDGDIFIANHIGGIVLFSVCGNYVYDEDEGVEVCEIDADLIIRK